MRAQYKLIYGSDQLRDKRLNLGLNAIAIDNHLGSRI